ncbi:MAG: hypothetical protein ABR540_11795 [Acidimicrobiales bacterium]|nr:hypothetical protein [Actinomycetota bacterium]
MVQDGQQWEEHEHEAAVHAHGHYHVTHNYREMSGAFEHLSSFHEHEHDHAVIRHSHYPHADFQREHEGEAHVHDHAAPVKDETAKKAPARKSAKKAAAGAS